MGVVPCLGAVPGRGSAPTSAISALVPARTWSCWTRRRMLTRPTGRASPLSQRSGGTASWPPGPCRRPDARASDGENSPACRSGMRAGGLGIIREGPSMHEMEGPYPISQRQTPLTHAQARAARSTTKPDTRLKSQSPSSSCVRGAPRVVPVFGGERFIRPSCGAPQGVAEGNFKIF